MSLLFKMTRIVLLAALASASVGSANAFDTGLIGNGTNGVLNPRINNLPAIQSQQQRREFQNQQQQFRSHDSQMLQVRPNRIEVPQVRPTCQAQVYGNRITCR